MILAIMTRGRTHNQRTLENLPPILYADTYLVCPPDECGVLYSNYAKDYGVSIVPFRHDNPNYSTKFQALLDGSLLPNRNKVCILDDDLVFSQRRGDKLHTLRTPEEKMLLTTLFKQMDSHLDHVPQCGVHPRQMGHQAPLPYKENGKVIVVNGINRHKLQQIGLNTTWRVDQHPILADTRLNMEVLMRGEGNRLITEFCVDWGASQAKGGCDYRTMEMQEKAIDDLVRDFGPFIKKVVKKPKSAKWLGDERVDFMGQWKKAYQTGTVRRQNP